MLNLVHLNQDTRLVVFVCREGPTRCLSENGSVGLNEGGHDTTSGLDNERNIEKEKVPSLLRRVTGKNNGLDSETIGNGLIGVDALVGSSPLKKSE
jgi:hypothetical protein